MISLTVVGETEKDQTSSQWYPMDGSTAYAFTIVYKEEQIKIKIKKKVVPMFGQWHQLGYIPKHLTRPVWRLRLCGLC